MEELIFGVIGGTALLMYGVDMMGDGLEKASGEAMKRILTVLTGKVWSAFLVGILVTAIVQSSTAVTVLTVGFVNSGLMKLPQAVGIIYGANIGTTVLAQLMAFSFKFQLTDIALPILGIGFAIEKISKNKKLKHLGQALMGFGMMFLGLKILNSGVPYMQESERMRYFFSTYASNPIIGILLGAFATAMVHSSAATTGLVMVLSQAGLISLHGAVYIMLGNNLGTSITAQLASASGNINARRTAWAHTLYNGFGVVLTLLFFPVFMSMVKAFTLKTNANPDISVFIANSHTLFNAINAIIFLPLTKYYVAFLNKVIKPKTSLHQEKHYLDEILLDTPVAALEASKFEIIRGTKIVKDMLETTMDIAYTKDTEKLSDVLDQEESINIMQKDLMKYIMKLSRRELTKRQSIMVPAVVSSINNVEKSADRVIEILSLIEKKQDQNLDFSKESIEELQILEKKVLEMCDISLESLNENFSRVHEIRNIENEVDYLAEKFQDNYVERLHKSNSNIDAGVLFIDMISHLERIADHIYKTTLYAHDELMGIERKPKAESL